MIPAAHVIAILRVERWDAAHRPATRPLKTIAAMCDAISTRHWRACTQTVLQYLSRRSAEAGSTRLH
eukprot:2037975-Rhodomonas_salina.1